MEKIIIEKIEQLLNRKSSVIVAIDGRCAAGKTTLCEKLQRHFNCGAVHLDDFFLRPEQRTAERYAQAGENVDHERFLAEVLLPIKKFGKAEYRPFDCKTQSFKEPIKINADRLLIVEGSYCCHPALREYYDLKIFLTVSADEQLERIRARNGAKAAEQFEKIWIPLEELYFSAMNIPEICLLFEKSKR